MVLRAWLPWGLSSNSISDRKFSMRAELVDRVSSFLLSLVILVGLVVFVLSLIFFLRHPASFDSEKGFEIGAGGCIFDDPSLHERELDEPNVDEVALLIEPSADSILELVRDHKGVEATIGESASDLPSEMVVGGSSRSRPPGLEEEGDDVIPRFDRWELKFTARDRRSYAIQLEALKIDIGAIGGGLATVDYVSSVANGPTKNSVAPKDEKARKRLKFISVSESVLLQYEKKILQAAGIPHAGRQILKFVPNDVEEQLAQAEAAYFIDKRSKDFRVTTIAKTVFECRQKGKGGGFEFVVIDQRYRVAGNGGK